ncbi:T9SS type A sorting domain-containing protein [Phnomibacter ginsenosidimutans]|uniref:T9SS type A sorting domain-containing protein n=2 Tax=Phnomibacter ginsenosidimutans TaxID=2676868 RepID=A0A6I6G9Z1_9BACT|nr:T9SS type A sorting domain-containing protein [Phnomibacter ginsenosidimutans]
MFVLNCMLATGQQITYSIADAAGRILMTNKQAVQQGMSQVSVDVSRMPAGILYLQIQTQDGQRTVQKLMKQ